MIICLSCLHCWFIVGPFPLFSLAILVLPETALMKMISNGKLILRIAFEKFHSCNALYSSFFFIYFEPIQRQRNKRFWWFFCEVFSKLQINLTKLPFLLLLEQVVIQISVNLIFLLCVLLNSLRPYRMIKLGLFLCPLLPMFWVVNVLVLLGKGSTILWLVVDLYWWLRSFGIQLVVYLQIGSWASWLVVDLYWWPRSFRILFITCIMVSNLKTTVRINYLLGHWIRRRKSWLQ